MAKKADSSDQDAIVIKKYANRRLYNTATSSYVTLDHLAEMVKAGQDFAVKDAKSGEDITRSVLTQIIFEEEGKGQNLLPISFLRQLIGFYGDSLQGFIPSYLEMSMATFAKEQERLRERMAVTFGGHNNLQKFEEQMRQNMAMFDNAMRMFAPFSGVPSSTKPANQEGEEDHGTVAVKERERELIAERDRELDTLKEQMAQMQQQLRKLADKDS